MMGSPWLRREQCAGRVRALLSLRRRGSPAAAPVALYTFSPTWTPVKVPIQVEQYRLWYYSTLEIGSASHPTLPPHFYGQASFTERPSDPPPVVSRRTTTAKIVLNTLPDKFRRLKSHWERSVVAGPGICREGLCTAYNFAVGIASTRRVVDAWYVGCESASEHVTRIIAVRSRLVMILRSLLLTVISPWRR
jgi:hypothetical protein